MECKSLEQFFVVTIAVSVVLIPLALVTVMMICERCGLKNKHKKCTCGETKQAGEVPVGNIEA